MDKTNAKRPDNGLECPVCSGRAKALLGRGDESSLSKPRMKCRKCEEDYWENQQSGMLQQEMGADE